jgi:hypothetical protein
VPELLLDARNSERKRPASSFWRRNSSTARLQIGRFEITTIFALGQQLPYEVPHEFLVQPLGTGFASARSGWISDA